MTMIHLSIPKQKQPLRLKSGRAAFFEQTQLIEGYDDENCWLLFFFKQTFLTAVKTKKMKRTSYASRVWKEGLVYDQPNPLLTRLIDAEKPLQKINYPQLKKKAARHFTRQEQSRILTLFESFIPKKQLLADIKAIFYTCRREGKMFESYTIVREMVRLAPESRFVQEISHDLAFASASEAYETQEASLFKRDRLYAEEHASMEEKSRLLLNENREVEHLVHRINSLPPSLSAEESAAFLHLVKDTFEPEDQMSLLEPLISSRPSYDQVTDFLFDRYLDQRLVEPSAGIVQRFDIQPHSDQMASAAAMLDKIDMRQSLDAVHILLEKILPVLPESTGHLVEKYIEALFEKMEMEEIIERIRPLSEQSPSFEKIVRMKEISGDLDHLLELGEGYYSFHQLDQALECFQMEMELQPDRPEPLQWLAKVYQDKQMMEESKAYQRLCVDLQKRS
ncbi:hypothetical protein JF544_11410 [Halobacillus kuroshimensis]|uniref:Tetratricopeptide repeat protein n=1 Tax=Halobacillus kuroshimensis TaxID=302481 RepID=A0ABS3DX08_9BACI|nr:hypothetical protein [Halobacillus kuroshimensis]MBN8235861.1 hypothetical protein [Halobacillus kuroshimensis]